MKTTDHIARELVRVAAHADQQAWVEFDGVRVPLLNGSADAEKMREIVRRLVEQVRAESERCAHNCPDGT